MMLEQLGTHGGRGNSSFTQKLVISNEITNLNVKSKASKEKIESFQNLWLGRVIKLHTKFIGHKRKQTKVLYQNLKLLQPLIVKLRLLSMSF